MKIIDNICRLNLDGVTTGYQVDDGPSEIVVPAGKKAILDCLVFSGQVSVRVVLDGEGSSCDLKCIYLNNSDKQTQINFEVIHKSGQTESTQLVRGLATDRAKVSFTGRIRIPYDSQKCYATQNHRGILLSDKAAITAVPELEIYADDVQCSHGSAVGPLDKMHLFYLMARGIPENEAKKMLLYAFVQDILPVDFKPYLDEWTEENV
jgi:Fe-S cluster assembly scaffold protein SufB